MKKDPNQYPKGWNAAKVRRVLDYYENQSDEEAAAEIENAQKLEPSTWVQVPTDLVPQIERLVDQRKKSA